jgi:hypothetical protein
MFIKYSIFNHEEKNIQICSDLLWNEVELEITSIPSHMGLDGNELLDEQARHEALNGSVLIDHFRQSISRV